jgi:hypothetical protein
MVGHQVYTSMHNNDMHHFASHRFQEELDVRGTHISEVCFISGRNGPWNQLDDHVVHEFSEGAGEGMHTKETEEDTEGEKEWHMEDV